VVKSEGRWVGALFAVLAASSGRANAEPVADFYKGKNVSLTVSTSVGGGYDMLARAVARFLGKHVPGNPTIIVKNMAGAGGIVATNFLYNVAEKDGTNIGLVQDNTPFKPLLGTKEARYDPTKFNWLGSPSPDTAMLVVWGAGPVSSLDDVRKRETAVGAAAVNSTPAFYARLMNELLGTKLKVIVGYPGQSEAFLAMEHGEIDGYPSVFYSTLQATKPDWLPQKKIRAVVYFGPDKRPELGDVPYAPELVTNENDKILMDAAFAPLTLGKLFVMPPDVPADQVATMRKALRDTFADPEFVAESERLRLGAPAPRSGGEIGEVIRRTYASPPRVLDRLQKLNTVGP
jgi:tripartite-type tricarboxylate transporter receptor subunit TctC